ncbi:sulfur carrier protein ThiS adenylyltransferase ThiF [Nitratidesulfovibrio sp. D1]|uniref:sulfur carrier protein ThiS adenylyltransferase ThiF n=1 Tax=Nitratidesulfovibrio sp. D1 TaxID=3440151 RepID=UPI003EC0C68A
MSILSDGLARYLEHDHLERMAAARVGIAGAGGLGSNCAAMLVRSGLRRLVVADRDVVEPSNLNRQQYQPFHLGKSKVDALAESLRIIEPRLVVTARRVELTSANVAGVFAGCDILVEALDDPEAKRMFVEAALEMGAFVVSASGMGGWGGPAMQMRRIGERMVLVGDFTSEVGQDLPPLAPRVTMAAAMQADAVLHHILGPCPGFMA